MKLILILAVVMADSLAVVGQNGFNTVIPDRPVNLSQVNGSHAWVRGHWVGPELTGPSTSEIYCDHASKTCTDTTANIAVDGNAFSMGASQEDYTVERWDSKEIVASSIAGDCRVRNVIKFDLVQKRVLFMQTLSEPIDDLPKALQDACKFAGMHLELKDSAMWRK
jgi:hypothetical protein